MAKIVSENQYRAILKRIDFLFDSTDEKTVADDPMLVELDLLSQLVEEYEAEHCPIEAPSLTSTLEYKMKELNYSQKELAVLLGMSAPRLSDIVNGKKEPTLQQARSMVTKLGIDPAILLSAN